MIDLFEPEDAEACSAMIKECVTASSDFNRHEAQLIIETDTAGGLVEKSKRFPLFVYRREGKPVGICGLDGNEIRGCFIRHGRQRQGIGRELIEHLEQYAKMKGVR
jgi:GNAT superfamily N-acetyltransferase